MISQSKKLVYGLLSFAAVTSLSLVSATTPAQATTVDTTNQPAVKPLASTPKALRGYWYGSSGKNFTIMHFTSKHEYVKYFKNKSKKQSFLKLNKKKHSKYTLSKKLIRNKTYTFSKIGHNNWVKLMIEDDEDGNITYPMEYYYLRGSKKKPKLILMYQLNIGGFNNISTSNPSDESGSWSKASHKYLKSIGFYK